MFKILDRTPVDSQNDKRQQQALNEISPLIQAIRFSTHTHPSFEMAYDAILDTFENYGIEPSGCCMFGPPGSGKSRLLRYFLCDIYSQPKFQPTDTITPIPVICVPVPGRATIPKLCDQILTLTQGVYTPVAKTGVSPEYRVDRMLEALDIRMIIFDEFQHLLREEATISTAAVLAFIKLLMDKHGLTVVLSGKPNAQKLLDDHPELQQRVSYANANLQHFHVRNNGPGNMEEFGSYLMSIVLTFNEHGVSFIPSIDEDFVKRIHIATSGIPRYISTLFTRVARLAANEKRVTQETLQKAYDSVGFNKSRDFKLFTATESEVSKYVKRMAYQKKREEEMKTKHKRGSRQGS